MKKIVQDNEDGRTAPRRRKPCVTGKSLMVGKSEPLGPDMVRFRSGLVLSFMDMFRMNRAVSGSIDFMKGYGKGRKPFMIDKSHYLSPKPDETSPAK